MGLGKVSALFIYPLPSNMYLGWSLSRCRKDLTVWVQRRNYGSIVTVLVLKRCRTPFTVVRFPLNHDLIEVNSGRRTVRIETPSL